MRRLYETLPYPDLGADLKDMSLYFLSNAADLEQRGRVAFLDAGCGTGHVVVGVAKRFAHWRCCAIDLSQASLDVAGKLADRHGADVTFHRGSDLDPLPFEERFDVISAMGTIHHSFDPVAALTSLRQVLKDDGWLLLHLYGRRCDEGKFHFKDVLSIMQPDLMDHHGRFALYESLMRHKQPSLVRRLAKTSMADIWCGARKSWRNFNRRRRNVSWSPPWTDLYPELSSPWVDHYCHPLERAYEIPDIRALVEASGFRVMHILSEGKEKPHLIPPEWKASYERLDDWSKWRLSELLSEGHGSFAMILRKAGQ